MLTTSFIGLLAICGFALGQGNPTLKVDMKEVSIENKPKSRHGKVTAKINPGKRNTVSLDLPLKEQGNENTMVDVTIMREGEQLIQTTVSICEAIKNDMFGKDFVAAGKPFPKQCPIEPNDLKIVGWRPLEVHLPGEFPDGLYEAIVKVSQEGSDPDFIMTLKADISHSAPGLG